MPGGIAPDDVRKEMRVQPMSNSFVEFTKPLIGAEWRGDTSAAVAVSNPLTGGVLVEVATSSVADCVEAVELAAAALVSWKATAPRQRAEILRRAFELMIAERDQIARLIAAENGKAYSEAVGEVTYAAEFFRWFSEEASRVGGELRLAPNGDKRIMVTPQAVGVCVLITPWNFPAAMATRKIGPALAAGCTCILKPAPETPLTAFYLADLLLRAGLPAGVLSVVLPEPPAEAVAAMLRHPAVRKLSFTGSTVVGQVLLRQSADRVLRTSLELGGNAPFVVLADSDVAEAVEAAMLAKMRNVGASCVAANRFYVHASVADEFTSMFANRMGALRVGLQGEHDAEVGALVTGGERDKVADIVDKARSAGARVVTGGTAPSSPGFFYSPTVLAGVAPDSAMLSSEIFGPVAPIVVFEDEADAIRLANGTDAGLIAYVMSRNLSHALSVAEQLDTGMVAINRGVISDPAAPFGGMKSSGLGREGGFEGIEEYLERKYIGVAW
jgi:succinate-semialdehyde dehydrogenase / glutarate-semialdehyde dehydrogenase